MANPHTGKPKTWEYFLIIGAIIIFIILMFMKSKSSSGTTPATSSNTIPTTNVTVGGAGPVFVGFSGMPTTTGIATYIPLFGFVRSGFSM